MTSGRRATQYVFGPVPSRRLGRSLGVDLVPFKTCTYDCIYCQLGRTTRKTIRRKEWAPTDEVLRQIRAQVQTRPDYITLSGSGEPTLHSRIGELIDGIKAMSSIPVAVLTNGSLLWQPAVRAQLAHADLVLPSLDAGDNLRFRVLNRPHKSLSFERVAEGLVQFRRQFRGQYWLEVFLLRGYTGLPSEVEKLVEWVKRIAPDRVQLNTVARPPAEEFAFPVPSKRLNQLAGLFTPRAEVIAEFRGSQGCGGFSPGRDAVLGLLRRRPCTVLDVAGGLGLHRTEALKLIESLEVKRQVVGQITGGQWYYRAMVPSRFAGRTRAKDRTNKIRTSPTVG